MASCTYNCLMNVINIGNSIIGVSILAMPYCFRKCGILLSFVLIVISGLLTKLACYLILKSAVMARRRSFEFLAFHTFGSYGKLIVEMCVIGFLIGVCIAFFVVIGDLGPPLAAEMLNIENTPNLRTNVLMLVGVCVALPLGLLRKIDSLTSLSALSIAFYVCLILKIFAEAVPNLSENEWWFEVNWWKSEGILPCLPIFSMALSCQTQLFEFFDTTNDPSLKRMQSVIDGAVCLCSSVYLMVGIFGYIAFHDKNITGNVLVLLTPSVITEFIKFGFILTVAVSFPLCLFPCRSSLHSLLFKQGFVHHDPNINIIPDHRFRILTVSLVIVTIGIAIMLPNIEFVLGIIGSTIGTLICLILPAAIFIYDSNKMTSDRRKAQILCGIGIFILIACTFSTLNENHQRPQNIPSEITHVQKITPISQIILSSPVPAIIIQSPKIILEEQPVIKTEKKIEALEPKIEDQKRLEPPIPQEPEIKVDQNADLDPQALQKEDKELQKDASRPVSAASPSKKEDGLDKQEKVLEKLEKQQLQQEKILEQQKQILEQLKQHKESHEELRRSDLLGKQDTNKKNDASVVLDVKQDDIKVQPNVKMEDVKIIPKADKILVDKDIKPEPVINTKSETKLTDKNFSIDAIPVGKLKQDSHINKVEILKGNDKLGPKNIPDSENYKLNETFAIKQYVQKPLQNFTINKPLKNDNLIGKSNLKVLDNPSSTKASVIHQTKSDNLDKAQFHVKHRETLAKKTDSELVASLPRLDSNVNVVNSKNKDNNVVNNKVET